MSGAGKLFKRCHYRMGTLVSPMAASADTIQALTTRLAGVNLCMKRLVALSKRLENAIGGHIQLQTENDIKARWEDVKRRLEVILQNTYTTLQMPVPPLSHCGVVLERRCTKSGEFWMWKLYFPEETSETSGGRHRKVLLLNACSVMPAYCESSEEVVSAWVDLGYIDQEIVN